MKLTITKKVIVNLKNDNNTPSRRNYTPCARKA